MKRIIRIPFRIIMTGIVMASLIFYWAILVQIVGNEEDKMSLDHFMTRAAIDIETSASALSIFAAVIAIAALLIAIFK